MPSLSGICRNADGSPAEKLVRVYRRDTGVLVGAKISSAATGAWSVTTPDSNEHFAIEHDAIGDPSWDKTSLFVPMTSDFSDARGHSVVNSGAATSTAVADPFGGTNPVGYFNGAAKLSVTADAVGAGEFTIEGFFRTTTIATGYYAIYFFGSTAVYVHTDKLVWYEGADRCASASLSANTWYEFSLCRVGTTITLRVNGVATGSTYTSAANYSVAAHYVGMNNVGGEPFNGYLSYIRVSSFARYTSNYTASVAPFLNGLVGGANNALIRDRLTPA